MKKKRKSLVKAESVTRVRRRKKVRLRRTVAVVKPISSGRGG